MDQIGAVVALRRGKTFFLPGEDFYIVESNLMTSREPVFANFGIVEIGVLVFDESENLLGIQKSIEKNVLAGEKRSIDFFWPGDFNGRVTVVRVEPRVNILDKENILRR